MAIIYKCDICQREIGAVTPDTQEMGDFRFREKTYKMAGKNAERVVREDLYIFCLECSKKIRDFIKSKYDEKK